MKDLLYLKDEQIKEFIQLLYYAYRETFSDPKDVLSKKFFGPAHLRALNTLNPGQRIQLNLGSGVGTSVLEIVEHARKVTGHDIPAEIGARRSGDPPWLIADNSRAKQILGWTPEYSSLDSILTSAWRWHQRHPQGYETT